MDSEKLLEQAKTVITKNDHGGYTIPAEGLYPHQWLWDSCFIAIGMRQYDVDRAQSELLHLLRGQWSNGMLPNIVFSKGLAYREEHNIWHSQVSPYAPDDVPTSGITQPPVLAEAIVRVGEKMTLPERRLWYKTIYLALLSYHEWLYADRDPHEEGLVLQVHPWETGMDNTPPWMEQLHEHLLPFWIRAIEKLHLSEVIRLFRRDTHYVPAEQRLGVVEALALYSTQRRLRRKRYDIDSMLTHSLFCIEDLGFNCMLIRANHHLKNIAKTIRRDLPEPLVKRMKKSEEALEQLWDAYSAQYFSRNFITHKLIKESSVATLLPLYAGSISKERAAQLVKLLHDKHLFGANFPVPSVPLNSAWFKAQGYWQGPTWININWLIIDGLKRYGFDEEAAVIRERSLAMVGSGGCWEYFSPLDGSPAGAENFSWTAALSIDLLNNYK